MRVFLLFLPLALLTLFSCRSTKTIQQAISKKDTVAAVVIVPKVDAHADSVKFMQAAYKSLDSNLIQFNTFSAKVKVVFEDREGKRNDLNAFIRLKKDSVLWVMIDAVLGIEAFRIMITPDSIKVLNKIDHEVKLRSVSSLQEIAQLPFTFKELQNLIIGNPIYADSNILSYKKDEKSITLVSLGEAFKQLLTIDKESSRIQNTKLDDVDPSRARSCLVLYGNYQQAGNQLFSAYRKLVVTEKTSLMLEMDYKQFDFNTELSFPFSIPKNYKRK